jgi:Copper type II ascorbate-dependent monooxygenase, C-terminal domain
MLSVTGSTLLLKECVGKPILVDNLQHSQCRCRALWYWTGSILNVGTIPPKTKAYYNAGECTVQLQPGCEEIKVVAHAPHAHFIGTHVWTEHYTPRDKYGSLTYVRPCTCLSDQQLEHCQYLSVDIVGRKYKAVQHGNS